VPVGNVSIDDAFWGPKLRVNGTVTEVQADETGYWILSREWKARDTLSVRMDMPGERMEAHPNIESCRGKVAIQRGPSIYGFEGLDNGGNAQVRLESSTSGTWCRPVKFSSSGRAGSRILLARRR